MRASASRIPSAWTILALLLAALAVAGAVARALPPPPAGPMPGPLGNGVTLLPNGWKLAPAGRHLSIGDLPLSMLESPDGAYLIVANNGWSKPSLTVVDLRRETVVQKRALDHAWLGLAWHPDGKRVYSSGAAQNTVVELRFENGRLGEQTLIRIGPAWNEPGQGTNRPNAVDPASQGFIGGVAVTPSGDRLFAVQVLGQSLTAIDTASRTPVKTIALPAEGYTCVVSPDGSTVYVSVWGGARVLAFDARTLEPRGEIPVGEHPNAMAFSRDGARLFVACANTNAVWAIDLASKQAVEQIATALYPEAPPGSTPNALNVSPDGRALLVANADNNTVAVVDIATPRASRVSGFIPTGWYPTGVAYKRDGSAIFVLSGKGLTSSANPRGAQPGAGGAEGQYIGQMLQGSLSIVRTPAAEDLATYTRRVLDITAYSDATRVKPANAPAASPIPSEVGGASPIKHVFYVIRENRTYDQILGDLGRGNGDPTLCLFGEDVTPNAHALAREFVNLDAFFVDAEVSYDGHAFSTGAYATDFVEKIWPTNYGSRGAKYLSEGGGEMRNAYGNVTAPLHGYIWDACRRANVSVRSYGEFASRGFEPDADRDSGVGAVRENVPGLKGLVSPTYPPYDIRVPDNARVDAWLKEFREFERNGRLPALSIVRLGNDHTAGTRAGYPTPRAMIAENDQALGRLVEAISQSVYWKDSAIFVLEDDAQNGPDHVDAHRSVALVASPFARRGVTDSTLYTTSGMLRTIELILGLQPMSQYDAAATPMYGAFQPAPDPAPFARRPARVRLDEMNDQRAFGAEASRRMNLEEADMAPEFELNLILWHSVKGAGVPMPPPVRAAFLKDAVEHEADEQAEHEREAREERTKPNARRAAPRER